VSSTLLLGRRTFEIFAAYWPNQGDNPIAKAFKKATKHVVTCTLGQFDWKNSLHIGGDVVDEIQYRIWVFPLVHLPAGRIGHHPFSP
jgi:dihydrofolate reductase